MFSDPSAPSSVLAVVSAVHLGLVALRNHRSAGTGFVSSVAAVSMSFVAAPWVFPSPTGLMAGVVAHAAWFALCERLATPPVAVPAVRATPPAARPAVGPATASPARAGAKKPKGFQPAPILAIFDETSEIRTFRLARPEGFEFVPGQFLAVRCRADGQEHVRCYSISSSPEARGYLEISVKRQGIVSNALHAAMRPGAFLPVMAPAGAFTYPGGDDRPIVLLAGGVGITPLMSMLRHAVSAEPTRPVTLLYSARAEADLAFRDELAALTRRHPQLRVFYAISRDQQQPTHYPGRIDETLLRTAVPDIKHSITLICGPQPMIDGLKVLLTKLGVPSGQVRSEYFEAAVAVSSRTRAKHEARGAREGPEEPEEPEGHEVEFVRSKVRIRNAKGQTLLEAAEQNGVDIPSLCKAGVCGTCRTRVVDGDVDCESDLLDADDRQQGVVLACVSSVRGPCRIEA
jgi:ferredoxin-NADP reductase